MDNIIKLTVTDRSISVTEQPLPIVAGNVGVDFVDIALDDEWDGLTKRVTFDGWGEPVSVDYADTVEIPWETIAEHGYLRVGVVGYGEDGTEVLRTKMMRKPLEVNPRSADMGMEAAGRTMDVAALAEKRMDELEAAIPAAQAAADVAIASAHRADSAADGVTVATTAANAAATAANAAAADVKARADAGEFDGKDGSDATATDVRINGISITEGGVANIPLATTTDVVAGMTAVVAKSYNNVAAGQYGSNSTYQSTPISVDRYASVSHWNSGSNIPLDVTFHFEKQTAVSKLRLGLSQSYMGPAISVLYKDASGNLVAVTDITGSQISYGSEFNVDVNQQGVSASIWVVRFVPKVWVDVRLCAFAEYDETTGAVTGERVKSVIVGGFETANGDTVDIQLGAGLSNSGRTLSIVHASNETIRARSMYYPLVGENVDYAVKSAICAPITDTAGMSGGVFHYPAWTDAEKLAAMERLGLGGDFQLIEEITLSEATDDFIREVSTSGLAYDLIDVVLVVEIQPQSAASTGYASIFAKTGNSWRSFSIMSSFVQTSYREFAAHCWVSHGRLFGTSTGTGASSDSNARNPAITTIGLGRYSAPRINGIRIKKGDQGLPSGTNIKIYGVWA